MLSPLQHCYSPRGLCSLGQWRRPSFPSAWWPGDEDDAPQRLTRGEALSAHSPQRSIITKQWAVASAGFSRTVDAGAGVRCQLINLLLRQILQCVGQIKIGSSAQDEPITWGSPNVIEFSQ